MELELEDGECFRYICSKISKDFSKGNALTYLLDPRSRCNTLVTQKPNPPIGAASTTNYPSRNAIQSLHLAA